jgi:hypothetical protein
MIGAIIASKFLIKHRQNYAIPLNTYICNGFLSGSMFTIAYIFFGYGSFPFLKTIKPKIILENTMNAHLFGFKLMPYSLHF